MKRSFTGGLAILILFLACVTVQSKPGSERLFKEEFLYRINKARKQGCNCGDTYMAPAPPLVWNDQLTVAAKAHALDMSEKNYFSHTSKDGRSMSDRAIAAGYGYKGYKSYVAGENIAQGQMSIAEVMDGWLKSPGHCKNLMNPSFTEIGIAEVNHYWVQDFGGRESFSAEQQKLIRSGRYRVIQKGPVHD